MYLGVTFDQADAGDDGAEKMRMLNAGERPLQEMDDCWWAAGAGHCRPRRRKLEMRYERL